MYALVAARLAACSEGDIILGTGGALPSPVDRGRGVDGPGAGAGVEAPGLEQGQGGAAAGSGGSAGAASPSAVSAGAGGPITSDPPPLPAADGGSPGGRPSAGCGKEAGPPEENISVGTMRASYELDLPLGYDRARAYPLVLAFRGSSVTAEDFRRSLNLLAAAGTEAIVVHPNCLDGAPTWEFQRDMPLVDALVAELADDYCVDQDRVFALGEGSGSMFTNLVGCVRANVVRAIAPLSGVPPPPGPCAGNVAVWMLQSTAEPTVGLGLGNRDFWVGRNGCDLRAQLPVTPSGCVEFRGCHDQFPVRYCEHSAAGSLPSDAAIAAWAFFREL